MIRIQAAFLQIFNKTPKYDKSKKVHLNGVDNNYPDFVESIISESVTASRCAKLMADYISGKGFGDELNKVIVHKEKQTTLLKFAQDIAESIAEQNGVFIHCNYDGNHDITSMDVLPFSDCRVGKKDGNDYSGKILTCNDWGDNKKVKQATVIDVYNPDKKVIQQQIEAAEGINNYNGQILYFRFGKYTYPLAPIHPCIKDAECETKASIYKYTLMDRGFFGKTLVVTKPMVSATPKEEENYKEQLTQRENFRKTIKQFVGAENSDGVMHMEMEYEGDSIEDDIIFKNIDSNIDDKLFAHTEKSVGDNVRMCFNNVPGALIRSQDGKLFGSSGKEIDSMKEFYQEQTSKERMILNEIVNKLMSHFVDKQENLKIIPLTIPKQEVNVN